MKEKVIGVLARLAGALIVIAILAAIIIPKVSVWNECRKDHSVLYCVHLVG